MTQTKFVKLSDHPLSGILAGTRPCGTIVLIGELFGSESVSQAYGNVHTFLQENTNARDHLSKDSIFLNNNHLKNTLYRVHRL